MDYIKKIVILKQTKSAVLKGYEISGILRLEREDELLTLSLSLINTPYLSKGEYFLALALENNPLEIFPLGKKAGSHIKTFNLKNSFNGVSAGLFSHHEGESFLLSFGSDGGIDENALIEAFLLKNKQKEKCALEYNDDAVATENYYSLNESIAKKVDIINGLEDESRKDEYTKEHYGSQEKEKGCASTFNALQDEECAKKGERYSREHPYYIQAREELEELFLKFPSDESLSSTLPNGRFCRINYAEGKYYLVGTIEEKGEVKYVCYGVPMEYSTKPPEKLKDYCSFIPLSFFDMQGKGVWMMFQDAITGECIKKENA